MACCTRRGTITTAAHAKKMEAREVRVLAELGIADPYLRGGAGGAGD